MNRFAILASSYMALGVALPVPQAFAQTPVTYKCYCHNIGTAPQEPLGDREGHSISVSSYSCRVEGGPLDGGVLTGASIFEWDKTNGLGLSGDGVGRKAGAALVYQLSTFKNTLSVADGKVTGFLATGRGTYKLATGGASSLSGRSFTYTARPAGSGQFTIDVNVE
jgi:hypothetical protein